MTNMQTGDRRPPHAARIPDGEGAGADPGASRRRSRLTRPFAEPLKKFPATVSAEDQKRISDAVLDAIATQVLPSYQRFAKFLSVTYIPNCRKDPGIWALPDGDAYYAFRCARAPRWIRPPLRFTRSAWTR